MNTLLGYLATATFQVYCSDCAGKLQAVELMEHLLKDVSEPDCSVTCAGCNRVLWPIEQAA